MGARMHFTGTGEMSRRMRFLATEFPNLSEKALVTEALIEKREVIKSTPIKTGKLRSTIRHEVLARKRMGRELAVAIVAGGPAAPYAIVVHEDPDAYHPIGQWKYIEEPLNRSTPYLKGRIASRIAMRLAVLRRP